MKNVTPRRLSALFAAIVIPLCSIALTACQPECVDKYDCRAKGTAGQAYACVDNQCVPATPEADAGVDAGTDAGTETDGGTTEDAGTDAGTETDGGLDGGETDGGTTDGGTTDGGSTDAGFADAGFFKLISLLSGDQAEPPITSPHTGAASFTINLNQQADGGHSVAWAATFASDGGTVTSLTSVDVFAGAAARNGTLVQNLYTNAVGTQTSPQGGTFVISPAQAQAMIAGRWYVQESITTTYVGFPATIADVIRGQIYQPGEVLYVARMSGANEVPPTNSTAVGGGHILYPSDGGDIRYFAQWDALDGGAAAAHVHLGDAGQTGGVALELDLLADGGGVRGSADAGLLDPVLLNTERYYLNAHSPAYPNGEIRGQLIRKN